MLFAPELRIKIAQGIKTQTRRPVKAGETLVMVGDKLTVMSAKGKIKMQVGRDYAVQYGYGKPGAWWNPETKEIYPYENYLLCEHEWLEVDGLKPLRIRVLDIRQVLVSEISFEDALAEGFTDRQGFWDVWAGFYGDKEPLAFAYRFEVK